MQFAHVQDALRALSERPRVGFIEAHVYAEGESLAFGASEGRSLGDGTWPIAIGCVAELLVATLALMLADQRAIDLDQPVTTLLPELAGWANGAEVTYRNLLSRSCGVQDPRSPSEAASALEWGHLASRLVAAPTLLTPGAAFCYAGPDLSTLVEAVQRASGQHIREAAAHHLLTPLGLVLQAPRTRRAAAHDGAAATEPPGLTSRDLLQIARHIAATDGAPGILSSESRRRVVTGVVDLTGGVPEPRTHSATGFSEGAFLFGDGLVGFDGQDMGQACGIRFDPSRSFAAAVTVSGPPQVRDAAVTVLAEAFGFACPDLLSGPRLVGRLQEVTLQEATGEYEGWARGHRAVLQTDGESFKFTRVFDGRALRSTSFSVRGRDLFSEDPGSGSFRIFRDVGAGTVAVCAGNLPYAMVASRSLAGLKTTAAGR